MHFRRVLLNTVAAGLLFPELATFGRAQAPANATAQVLTPEVDAFIDGILSDWNTAGGAGVAVVRMDANGEWQIETKGYGKAKADGSNVTADTLFSIGSNSKLFTVLAAGLLVSNESLSPRISWNTKIASVIPEWELIDPLASNGSTIVDLMSHRTGLPRHDLMFKLTDSVSDVIKRLRFLRSSTEFRQTWQYSNIMYGVLSHLPTALLPGQPLLSQYAQEHIFDPLGMNSTTYSFDIASATGLLADGFGRQAVNAIDPLDGGIPHALPFWAPNSTVSQGAGGIISNAKDMATWLQALLLNGRNPQTNVSVIPAGVIDMAATGITVMTGKAPAPYLSPQVYGGGQWQDSYRGHVLVEVSIALVYFC
ncbi:hypothetical protein HGRIS_005888 [Hohenbuehelia grisea]|uniref:Beta-lactamase-related domain-containing protein n=1 Tax=Hohenbuehelia grisea TaxID=104357 RepID=A0ABR3JY55_9AGAR